MNSTALNIFFFPVWNILTTPLWFNNSLKTFRLCFFLFIFLLRLYLFVFSTSYQSWVLLRFKIVCDAGSMIFQHSIKILFLLNMSLASVFLSLHFSAIPCLLLYCLESRGFQLVVYSIKLTVIIWFQNIFVWGKEKFHKCAILS